MFDYGFASYRRSVLALAGREVRPVPVTGSLCRFVPVRTASDVYYPLAEGEQVRAEILLPDSVKAPVQAGEEAGRMVFYLGDQPIGETALVYAASAHVDSAGDEGLWDRFLHLF